MKNSLTIAGKELAGYFLQPVAYVVMTVFLLLGGFFFFALLRYFEVTLTAYSAMQNPAVLQRLNLNERVIEPMLHNLAIVLVILVPAITMRSFAEEKRTGTYELLLTAPIRTGEIVAGKIIAAISCFGSLLFLFVISWPAQAGGTHFLGLLQYLSLPDHFAQMVTGIIDTRVLVYFLSLIFVALFLTQRSVESARWR